MEIIKDGVNQPYLDILAKIKRSDHIILKLIKYLEDNDLLSEFYSKVYYRISKGEPVYEIKYYKHKITGQLFTLYDVRNSFKLLSDLLEEYKEYAYDETKTLVFADVDISTEKIRREEYCRSYYSSKNTVMYPLILHPELDLVRFFKTYPSLFIQCVIYFNIDMNVLGKVNTDGYMYKKEIKKN